MNNFNFLRSRALGIFVRLTSLIALILIHTYFRTLSFAHGFALGSNHPSVFDSNQSQSVKRFRAFGQDLILCSPKQKQIRNQAQSGDFFSPFDLLNNRSKSSHPSHHFSCLDHCQNPLNSNQICLTPSPLFFAFPQKTEPLIEVQPKNHASNRYGFYLSRAPPVSSSTAQPT